MITSRRDYLLRIIEEVSLALARVTTLRASRRELDALQSVVGACERLFGLEADKLFQLTPAQHFGMLTENEPSELARERGERGTGAGPCPRGRRRRGQHRGGAKGARVLCPGGRRGAHGEETREGLARAWGLAPPSQRSATGAARGPRRQ